MRLLSDLVNNGHIGVNPGKCRICGKLLMCSVHTEFGFLHVCPTHTDEELCKYVESSGGPENIFKTYVP